MRKGTDVRTIMDYLATEFATFDEVPFCAVDALVLSEFCMVRMEKVLPPMPDEASVGGQAVARLRSVFPGKRGVRFKDALLAEHYHDCSRAWCPKKSKSSCLPWLQARASARWK